MVCQFLLYNKVNQLYVYIYPHIPQLLRLPPTLPIPPLQVVTKHRADLPVLCGCFPLAIYFTFGSVYMSMPPLTLSQLPLPLPRVLKSQFSGFKYIQIVVLPSPLSSLEHFHHPIKKPHTHQQLLLISSQPAPLQTQITTTLLCISYRFVYSGHFL